MAISILSVILQYHILTPVHSLRHVGFLCPCTLTARAASLLRLRGESGRFASLLMSLLRKGERLAIMCSDMNNDTICHRTISQILFGGALVGISFCYLFHQE